MLPAIMALTANFAKTLNRDGANKLRPPIAIPTCLIGEIYLKKRSLVNKINKCITRAEIGESTQCVS
jgi:hypothetical protein